MSEIDDIFRAAGPLTPDERLRLVARLWKTLPRDHRAALVTLQLEDAHGDRERSAIHRPDPPIDPIWPKVRERLFDRSHASGLYSAPRRFDLATIFVVTAAFSLLLGGLTLMGAPPVVKVVIAGLIGIIATTQALFQNVASPRGVSIIAGAVAYTLMSWIIWYTMPFAFPIPFFVVMFINGVIGGSIAGYLLGTLVGGVFLVADVLRGKFEGRAPANAAEDATKPANSFAPDAEASKADAPN